MISALVKGHLYRLRSRNLPYGVYDGQGGFTGIREKFGELYLATEYDYGLQGGTASAIEDLGPAPDGEAGLFEFLASAERQHGRGVGYGGRPGDEEMPGWNRRG